MVELWLCILSLVALLLFLCRAPKMKAPQFLDCERSCQRYLFRELWDAGFYPEVNYLANGHIIDIAFPYSKVAIECGRNRWETNDLLCLRTKKKQSELSQKGWKFIQLSPEEIYGKPRLCVGLVQQEVNQFEHIY